MSHPRANIVSGPIAAIAHHSPLQDDDDDDLDDICPVCESECTCRKKSTPSTAPAPSASSSLSSGPSAPQSTTSGKRPLKIKLTLPPNLKARKPPATHASSTAGAHIGTAAAGPSSSKAPAHLAAAAAPAPKRRGRPPKALAAARKKAAADDMDYRARGTTGTSARVRQVYQPPAPSARASTADLSDSTLSDYPTFVPAASESTHSSSSESSDESITSDSEDDDTHHVVRTDPRQTNSTKLLPGHLGHSKKRGNNKWENKPRRKSVGPDGEEQEDESSEDSGESSDDSSEDGDDEDDGEDDAEADVEADVEGGGLLADAPEDLDDESETHSRIGVSFPGSGYSDDDEESNFDADIFFANLDSDSGDASSPEPQYSSLGAFGDEDVELMRSFSADEEDTLLLMDIDPSVQLRRTGGEFGSGVDLDALAFGWDGQLLFSNNGSDGLGLSLGFGAMDEDEDMGCMSGSDDTASWDGSNAGTIVLQESDGETTEDELVDSDGLPNPRAMMLFKWPTTISAINPLSTMSPSSVREPPTHASPSTRIALASMHRGSPPPAPSPADILAGRVSVEELEDIEMERLEKEKKVRRRASGAPVMGEFFVQDDVHAGRMAAVVGTGCEAPSFFPRPVRVHHHVEPMQYDITPSEDMDMSPMRPPLTTESSEDAQDMSQAYTSELSSTEAIELDDVLDSSLLDSEPHTEELETDVPGSQTESSPVKSGASPHLHNLSRWDRIPMATFRRTRESATASGVDGAVSDGALGVLPYHRNIGAMMGGMSLFPNPPRPLGLDKMSRASARKRKGRHSHGSSPTLLPARDGTLGSPFAPAASSGSPYHSSKSKKEIKKEKAMMKRKMVAKSSQYRYHQPSRSHHHHPNQKSRATNAVQRVGFSSGASSSIPTLSI
ncbi:hypothetical protein K466DRAFT_482102 [Polyporus arcularius HHB13444]|uniref:Uncharacterized protein n=1 Tax=Polyporus arcularius HHB13444 TaxID=1314778 RepID=A0A5C3PSZ8_9APHY|nr:hypothetical protein K466DRAFT_482102 [Polyporus arcularius HHB13444]